MNLNTNELQTFKHDQMTTLLHQNNILFHPTDLPPCSDLLVTPLVCKNCIHWMWSLGDFKCVLIAFLGAAESWQLPLPSSLSEHIKDSFNETHTWSTLISKAQSKMGRCLMFNHVGDIFTTSKVQEQINDWFESNTNRILWQ